MARPIDDDPDFPDPPEPAPKPGGSTPRPAPPPPPPPRPAPTPPRDEPFPEPVEPGPGNGPFQKPGPGRPRPRPTGPTAPRPNQSDQPLTWPMRANGHDLQLRFYRRITEPTWRGKPAPTLGGYVCNVEWGRYEPALAYVINEPPSFDLPGGTSVHFVRLLDEGLNAFQIYHTTGRTSLGGIGDVFDDLPGPSAVKGEFFQYEWGGDRYLRAGPYAWSSPSAGNPRSVPMDGQSIKSDPGPWSWHYVSYQDFVRPGFTLSEWHHFNNPLSGSTKQRQMWGVYEPDRLSPQDRDTIGQSIHGQRPASTLVGFTRQWEGWRFIGEGVFYKDYAALYHFLTPLDARFDRFSVFTGDARRQNTFNLFGAYGGAKLSTTLTEWMIDGTTGEVIGFTDQKGRHLDTTEWNSQVVADENGNTTRWDDPHFPETTPPDLLSAQNAAS